MNWVGGKLQRHAKANSNKQQKAQRQYFARARQRLHHADTPLSPPALAHYHDPMPSLSTQIHPIAQPQLQHWSGAQARRPDIRTAQIYQDKKSSDPLEHAKRRLLKKTDWTGVLAARPLQITFEPASEMQRIGRRKRVSKEDHLRHPASTFNRRSSRNKRTLQALTRGRSPPQELGSQDKNYSIRIGSNIHHTQTTDPTSPEPMLPSDPMVLDTGQPIDQKRTAAPADLYLQPSPSLPQDSIQGHLLPLSKALDLSSFDDVKDRSSSVVRRASESSNPFVVQDRPVQDPNNPSDEMKSSSREPEVSKRLDSTGAEKEDLGQRPPQRHGGDIPCAIPHQHASTKGGKHDLTPRPRKADLVEIDPTRSQPHFTIDHQVLLERQLLQSSIPNSPPVQDGSPLPVQPHYATPSPNVPKHGSPQNSALRSSYFSGSSKRGETMGSEVFQDGLPPVKRRRIEATDDSIPDFNPGSQPQEAEMTPSGSGTDHEGLASSTPLRWRDKSQQAKRGHNQLSASAAEASQRQSKGRERIGDENEAWMKYVFPHDFSRTQNDFTFQPVAQPSRGLPSIDTWSDSPRSALVGDERRREVNQQRHDAVSAISIPTDVNTSLYAQTMNAPNRQQSETDFFSRLSPMEGFMGHRLGPVSTYANAAKSAQSYISIPSASTQSGLAASGHQLAYGPVSDLAQATPTHRKYFHPRAQRRLWGPQVGSDFVPISPMSPLTPAGTLKFSSPLWNSSNPRHANLATFPLFGSAHLEFGVEGPRVPADY